MKLIDLLVQELPKRGGWPVGAKACVQSDIDRELYFSGACPFESGIHLESKAEDEPTAEITREQYEAALAASQQPAWNGEGLPPVGAEFEYGSHRSVAKCIAVSYHHVFASKGDPDDEEGDYEEFLIDIGHSSFYPTRTETERRREEAIGKMMDCSAVLVEATAGLIYDAIASGKIPGVKLKD